MFSKIKSFCKKFYKSRKSVASFVLAMMLAFSAFMSTGIKSEAAYATQKFYFDLNSASSTLKSTFGDDSFNLVLLRATAKNPMKNYPYDFNGSSLNLYPFYFYCGSSWRTLASSKYIAVCTNKIFYCNDGETRSELNRELDRYSFGLRQSADQIYSLVLSSLDGINWSKCYGGFLSNVSCAGSAEGFLLFNPQYYDIMTSFPIRSVYTGEVAYTVNISSAEMKDLKNISDKPEPTTSPSGGSSSGSGSSSGGSSSGGSSGSTTEEETGFFASVKESLSNILTNIKELPSTVVNVPTTMINFWKNFIGSHSISDIITAIMDAPSNIFNAWKSFFGSHTFLELLNAVKNVPATVSSWWKDNLPSVIQTIKDVPSTVSGWWSDHLPEILQAIVNTPTTVWNWWKEQLPDVVNAIIESPKTVLSFWKDFFKEHSFSDILQAIADAPKDILKFWENLFGSDSIKDIFKDLLDVPSNLLNFWDNTIVGFIESVESKFTFIEEGKSNIQLIIDRLSSMSNPKPPVITLPFSKTVLSKYGVGDIEMTFEWLAPYHELLMNVESACLYVAFCVRQFFDIKNMLNATSGATNVLTRL